MDSKSQPSVADDAHGVCQRPVGKNNLLNAATDYRIPLNQKFIEPRRAEQELHHSRGCLGLPLYSKNRGRRDEQKFLISVPWTLSDLS